MRQPVLFTGNHLLKDGTWPVIGHRPLDEAARQHFYFVVANTLHRYPDCMPPKHSVRKISHEERGKAMRFDAEWLHTLLSLHWNYDKKGREAMGWVELETDDALQAAYEKVLSVFRLPETPISPNKAAEAVLHTLSHTDETALLHRFAAAAKRGDFAVAQEFRTYHYHRNATAERLLKVWDKPLTARVHSRQAVL